MVRVKKGVWSGDRYVGCGCPGYMWEMIGWVGEEEGGGYPRFVSLEIDIRRRPLM